MATTSVQISQLVLDQLARGEKRLLALVVATRRGMSGTAQFKGDLSVAVASALRSLVAAKKVVESEGVYSLRSPER